MRLFASSVFGCPPSAAAPRAGHFHPSSFILHPSRLGISLLEVLAAIGVLSVGLLGLAALLPIGRYTIAEATKADRAGNCGRAAIRDVVVRRMLNSGNWVNAANQAATPGTPSFLIDPEGVTNGMGATFASLAVGASSTTTAVQRISLAPMGYASPPPNASTNLADTIFRATDDLVIPMPEDMNPPQPIGRPQNLNASGTASALDFTGAYSWFVTATPMPNVPRRFTVSVVVCFNRNLTTQGERAVAVTNFFDAGLGGGSVQLARDISDLPIDQTASPPTVAGITLKENDWVALCSSAGLCRWYRVASIGDNTASTTDTHGYLTLIGPDWIPSTDPNNPDRLVALGQQVVGVYTTTVDLDTDPTWTN